MIEFPADAFWDTVACDSLPVKRSLSFTIVEVNWDVLLALFTQPRPLHRIIIDPAGPGRFNITHSEGTTHD